MSLASACGADLGECDMPLARTVVYDEDGLPAYEGQSMVQASCGSGFSCHAEGASGPLRKGVPAGLDFDMAIAVNGTEAEVARLGAGQAMLSSHAGAAYCLVESGDMPPLGEQTVGLFDGAARFHRPGGTRVPAIDSIEGLDRYRNWLACGAPVVERTTGTGTVGDVVPTE